MTNQHHTVVIHLEAKKGKEKELKELLAGFLEASKKESGCLNYYLHEDIDNVQHFVVFERWESKNHRLRHFEEEFNKALQAKFSSILLHPHKVHYLKNL